MLAIVRLIVIVVSLVVVVYGSMLALVLFVEPHQQEITENVPPARFNK